MLHARLAPWKHRSLRFGLGAATVGVTTLFGIARTKWLAAHLDAAGLGVVGQVVAAQTWFGMAASLGLAIPLTRAVGAARGAHHPAAERAAVRSAIQLAGPAVVVVAALLVLGAPWVSGALFGVATYASLLRIAAIGAAGYAAYVLVHGWLAGRADVRAPFAAAWVGGLVSVIATFALVPSAGLVGGVLANALFTPFAVIGALAFVRWFEHTRARSAAPLAAGATATAPASTGAMLLRVGLASLVLSLVDQGILLAVRGRFLRLEGVAANGYVQAALALSQQVGAVFYFYLSSYAFGTVSAQPDLATRRSYTGRQWVPLLGLAALACAVASGLAPLLVRLLYTPSFAPAVGMLRWMLVGELARIALQAWALAALPSGGVRLWLPLMLAFPVSFALAYAALERAGVGMASVALAYAIAGAVSFACTGVGMTRHGVTLRARDLGLAAAAFVAVTMLALALPA